MVCQLSLAGGVPQSQINKIFTTHELVELLTEQNLKEKENDKADIRHALMMSAIASTAGNKIPPKKFLIDWNIAEFDKEAYLKKSKNFWKSLSDRAERKP